MPEEILQNTQYVTDLTEWGKTTGWAFVGNTATHELCNAGSIYLDTPDFALVPGEEYELSFNIVSISGGYVRAYAGTTASPNFYISTGFKTETIIAGGTNPEFRFYSNADLVIEIFNIRGTFQDTSLKQTNSIAFSEKNNKWSDFRTFNPDKAFSMFTKLFSFKQGDMYVHNPEGTSRNLFYGEQYETIVKIPFNENPQQTKTFQGIAVQGNKLMITTTDGITTSLGQISELPEWPFLKYTLQDGVDTINVYSVEGVYSTSFLRDKNDDLINGAQLKGNHIIVELQTVETGILNLLSVAVHSERSAIGVR